MEQSPEEMIEDQLDGGLLICSSSSMITNRNEDQYPQQAYSLPTETDDIRSKKTQTTYKPARKRLGASASIFDDTSNMASDTDDTIQHESSDPRMTPNNNYDFSTRVVPKTPSSSYSIASILEKYDCTTAAILGSCDSRKTSVSVTSFLSDYSLAQTLLFDEIEACNSGRHSLGNGHGRRISYSPFNNNNSRSRNRLSNGSVSSSSSSSVFADLFSSAEEEDHLLIGKLSSVPEANLTALKIQNRTAAVTENCHENRLTKDQSTHKEKLQENYQVTEQSNDQPSTTLVDFSLLSISGSFCEPSFNEDERVLFHSVKSSKKNQTITQKISSGSEGDVESLCDDLETSLCDIQKDHQQNMMEGAITSTPIQRPRKTKGKEDSSYQLQLQDSLMKSSRSKAEKEKLSLSVVTASTSFEIYSDSKKKKTSRSTTNSNLRSHITRASSTSNIPCTPQHEFVCYHSYSMSSTPNRAFVPRPGHQCTINNKNDENEHPLRMNNMNNKVNLPSSKKKRASGKKNMNATRPDSHVALFRSPLGKRDLNV